MLLVSAAVPTLILLSGNFENAWEVVSQTASPFAASGGGYASISMIFIFAGILLSFFISHDFKSGFVKNIFTVHAKKQDYAVSKTVIGVFSSACMIVMYLIGTVVTGLITGKSFEVSIIGLLCCVLSKLALSVGFSALFTMINVFFRRQFGFGIAGAFVFGTGMLVMTAAAGLAGTAMEPLLQIFLYGSAVTANLSANVLDVFTSLVCSLAWAGVYTGVSNFILKHRDIA